MKFDKIIGKCDPNIVIQAEEKLSSIFTELAMGYNSRIYGTKLGGDIFLHQLVYPLKHNCDARALEFQEELQKINNSDIDELLKLQLINELKQKLGNQLLQTAATNGKEYFWAPQFIIKLSKIGLRLAVGHEGTHIMYMHPSRRGSRNPALWNIAVDFKVNYLLIADLKARGIYNPEEVFKKELGDFVSLNEYADFLKDPFNPPPRLAAWNPLHSIKQMLQPGYGEVQENNILYYAEPQLPDDLLRPEDIYEFLLAKMPVCTTCGKIGVWKKPKEFEELKKQLKSQTNHHE